MPTDQRAKLASIRHFDQLVDYLRDELDWPIGSENFEDLTFDYTPEELGIDMKNTAKIQEIKRLRPLSPTQPWGIFFVKFEPKRLPVVALRRILGQVALRKRASANSAERQAWAVNDLLFISNYGEGDERCISLAHFSKPQDSRDLPTLKVLGWDNLDTQLHLDDVAEKLNDNLAWPDDETDADAWRDRWRGAFTQRHREIITTSKELSLRLAELARAIRDRIRTAIAIETESGPLTKLMTEFQRALVHDLDAAGFADMYAQTIAYGLLSARIAEPEKKTADDFTAHMRTNSFLKELMQTFLHVGGRQGKTGGPGIDFDELGVSEVVELLNDANMKAVVRDFGDRNPQEDPIIHFYEDFLAAYDKEQKVQRGVFYTPRPVVSYIVHSVDKVLRTEFGLEEGLADTSTWNDVTKHHRDIEIPEGVSPDQAFVQILDPACGTGTFLVEVIDLIHVTMTEKWRRDGYLDLQFQGLWNEYVPKHLLPRLHGYELLMAPYAIAHLKIGLKLFETGYRFGSDERGRVYLTNAVEPASDITQMQLEGILPALAHEAQAVNEVKRTQRFTVVIGNPPYSGISSNRNTWIESMLKGVTPAGTMTANYYEVDGAPLGEKKMWLQDDYVKFMRLSHWLLEESSAGVHGMITNHSYLDSPTCRGMRFQMLRFYSRINILDLHGSTKRQEEPPEGLSDDNVFDILPGTSIAICTVKGQPTEAQVQSHDLWGTRAFKYDWLRSHSTGDHESTEITPSSPYHLLVERKLDHDSEYLSFPSLKDIYPQYGTGIQTSRDKFATDMDRSKLENRLRDFFDVQKSDRAVADIYRLKDTRGWKIASVRRSSNFDRVRKAITRCLFRTFDMRWIALTTDVVDWPRLEIMSCVSPQRLGLLCSRQQSTSGFRHALVVNTPVDMFCISNKSREGQTLFPLYVQKHNGLFESENGNNWRPNLGSAFVNYLGNVLGRNDARQHEQKLTDADVKESFDYIYALLYSPAYRARYADLLKMDYPRVPPPGEQQLFQDIAQLGNELVDLHLMQSSELDNLITAYNGPENPEVRRVGWSASTVWLDAGKTSARNGQRATKSGTVGFQGVSEEVWDFHIGGYQVCYKWLNDRKGRRLSDDEISHYQKIIVVLNQTIRTMKEIDDVIEAYGGWPGAFQSADPTIESE